MSVFDINGKTVLITGSTGGIGCATVRALYAKGANLVLTGRSKAAIDNLAEEFSSARVLGCTLDVTEAGAAQVVIEKAIEKFGRLDMVFANAGIASEGAVPMISMTEQQFENIIEVNLIGVWRTIKACLPHILETQGHVLLTASIYAFINGMCNAPYASSKAGVEMLGRALRAELAGTGATSGVLYLGWVATPMTDMIYNASTLSTEMVERAFPRPFGTAISPLKVAEAIVNGVHKRAARIVLLKCWVPLLVFRGLVNIISDYFLDKDKTMQSMVRRAELQNAKDPIQD